MDSSLSPGRWDGLENPSDPRPEADPMVRAAAAERHQALAIGLLALPNLFLRSVFTLVVLYGLLTLVLITIVQLGFLNAHLALAIGVVIAVLQFVLGPWIMDLSLRFLSSMRWVQPEELPAHLESFVRRVCDEHRMRFPSFGIINDGAPQAFTYGHHPSNARVVISRGLMELLEADELEAVVAHELGHARNWDMALMTIVNLVPLLLYYLYQVAVRFRDGDNKGALPALVVAIGAYVLFVISEYIVLWFSRTREYFADRFAGRVTGNPNALSRALIKIAYGLAAQDSKSAAEEAESEKKEKKPEKVTRKEPVGAGAWGALNIFDRGAAVNLVMSSAGGGGPAQLDVERVKGAMQWDLWNPWAKWFELNSTHPLVANRLQYLGDQAASLGQEPFVVFDRAKPESYWDGFLADLAVIVLPWVGLLAGLGVFVAMGLAAGQWQWFWLGVSVLLLGLGYLVKTRCMYRGTIFENLSVAALLGQVKVSPVRPVPATLTGEIIGKGVPGLIWSEDFVIRDQTGILFLDYQQPLAIWNFLFGLLRAGSYQGKTVRVKGWFRRGPTPYLEIYHLDVVDGGGPSRTCYTYHFRMFGGVLLMALGAALTAWLATL
jgi:Zn-dependent protease with chaperone function